MTKALKSIIDKWNLINYKSSTIQKTWVNGTKLYCTDQKSIFTNIIFDKELIPERYKVFKNCWSSAPVVLLFATLLMVNKGKCPFCISELLIRFIIPSLVHPSEKKYTQSYAVYQDSARDRKSLVSVINNGNTVFG